jgi:hypothetical protein
MDQIEILQRRLTGAERRIRQLSAVLILLGAIALVAAVYPQADVIRARGIIIEDHEGRERIVLGAPIANASSDARLGATVGLVVLDSTGRLNVALGRNTPLILSDGRSGERIATAAGVTIYDPRNGHERGGMGAFMDGRANVCLDYDTRSKEAVCLAVAPRDQYAAVLLNGTPGEDVFDRAVMYVGADGSGSFKVFGGRENQGGVMIRAGKGPPTITMYDSTGAAIASPD